MNIIWSQCPLSSVKWSVWWSINFYSIGVSVNGTFCAQVLLRFHKLRVNFGFLHLNNKKNWKIIGLERFQAIEVPWLDNYCCLKHKQWRSNFWLAKPTKGRQPHAAKKERGRRKKGSSKIIWVAMCCKI